MASSETEIPKYAQVIGFIMVFGAPAIDVLDKTFVTGPMAEQTVREKYECEQDKTKCWLIVK